MTDITELALLVSKAKASVFTLEYISQFEPADIDSDDVDLRFEVDGRDTGTNVSIVDECGQAAKVIGTLVEALEKAQGMETYWKTQCRGITDHCEVLQARIAELESHKAALLKFIRDSCYVFDGADEDISDAYVDAITSGLMPKLESVAACNPPLFWVRVKSDGGYEGPIHDSKLEEVRKKSGEWLPLTLAGGIPELESRTVTPVTYSENADADYCRKWAWEQVKDEVSTEDWTTGDSITYFGFFCWGWDMRRQYNEQRPVTVKIPCLPDDCDRTEAHYKYQAALRDAGIKVEDE